MEIVLSLGFLMTQQQNVLRLQGGSKPGQEAKPLTPMVQFSMVAFSNVRPTHATELVLDRPGFSETFDLLDFSKWSRR